MVYTWDDMSISEARSILGDTKLLERPQTHSRTFKITFKMVVIIVSILNSRPLKVLSPTLGLIGYHNTL
jgi:hypothetical protein